MVKFRDSGTHFIFSAIVDVTASPGNQLARMQLWSSVSGLDELLRHTNVDDLIVLLGLLRTNQTAPYQFQHATTVDRKTKKMGLLSKRRQ